MNHETHSIRRFAPLCATAADCDSEIALRRAESRALFAQGALAAAAFLRGRGPGLYGMEDMISL